MNAISIFHEDRNLILGVTAWHHWVAGEISGDAESDTKYIHERYFFLQPLN